MKLAAAEAQHISKAKAAKEWARKKWTATSSWDSWDTAWTDGNKWSGEQVEDDNASATWEAEKKGKAATTKKAATTWEAEKGATTWEPATKLEAATTSEPAFTKMAAT
eukprot:11861642-Prorocentrum_lima.AAC.1